MKKTLTLAAALLVSATAFAQVSVTYKVDITDYLAGGATLGANGMRVGGNYATQGGTVGGAAMTDWSPSNAVSAMTSLGSNIWSITVDYPASAVGQTQLYKFVNNDWGTNEGVTGSTIASNGCGVDDGSGNINRTLVIPSNSVTFLYCFDACFQCDGSSPNIGLGENIVTTFVVSPNPATEYAAVNFTSRKAGDVTVRVVNLFGQEVAELINGTLEAGAHSIQWNFSGIQAGTYFVEVVANGTMSVEKLFVTK